MKNSKAAPRALEQELADARKILDTATRELWRAHRSIINEWSGHIRKDLCEAWREVNTMRAAGGLPELTAAEVESYRGQLTEE